MKGGEGESLSSFTGFFTMKTRFNVNFNEIENATPEQIGNKTIIQRILH